MEEGIEKEGWKDGEPRQQKRGEEDRNNWFSTWTDGKWGVGGVNRGK